MAGVAGDGGPGLAVLSVAGQTVRERWREARTRPLREQIPRLLASLSRALGLPGGLRGPWLRPGRAHPLREGDGLGGAASGDSASCSCRSGSKQNLAIFLLWLPEGQGGNEGVGDGIPSIPRPVSDVGSSQAFVSIFFK